MHILDYVRVVRQHEVALHMGSSRERMQRARYFLRFKLRAVMRRLFMASMSRSELETLVVSFTPAMQRYVAPFDELLECYRDFDTWTRNTNTYDYDCYDELLDRLDERLATVRGKSLLLN